jgi:serine/threonine protein phosphatase PrpC
MYDLSTAAVRGWRLICTDGVTDVLGSGTLLGLLLDAPDLGAAAARIVVQAIDGGGSDNATAVVVHRIV